MERVYVDLGKRKGDPPETRVVVRLRRSNLSMGSAQLRFFTGALVLLAAAVSDDDEIAQLSPATLALLDRLDVH